MAHRNVCQYPVSVFVCDICIGGIETNDAATCSLQGMVFHQTYRYYRLYPKDMLFVKIWVRAYIPLLYSIFILTPLPGVRCTVRYRSRVNPARSSDETPLRVVEVLNTVLAMHVS